jgi:hypothetical protein
MPPMSLNPVGLIYGTITVGALLAAESANSETYLETVGAVVIALAIYWLARSYAEFTARRLQQAEPLAIAALGRTMLHELSILLGAAIPLLTLLVWWATGAQLGSAVTAALWASAAVTALIELAAGLRAKLTGLELLAQTAVGMILGLLVIALKLVLH